MRHAFTISIPALTHGQALETRGATYSISCLPWPTVCARESYSAFHTARTEGRVLCTAYPRSRMKGTSLFDTSTYLDWPLLTLRGRVLTQPSTPHLSSNHLSTIFYWDDVVKMFQFRSLISFHRLNEWFFLLYYTFSFFSRSRVTNSVANIRIGRLAARKFEKFPGKPSR